jgi:hypothetical protein
MFHLLVYFQENNNIDDKPDAESDIDASNGGFDNQGFCLSEEDLKASDEKKLIRKHKGKQGEMVLKLLNIQLYIKYWAIEFLLFQSNV